MRTVSEIFTYFTKLGLMTSTDNEPILGVKKAEASSSLFPAKKKQSKKHESEEEEEEEWYGFGT